MSDSRLTPEAYWDATYRGGAAGAPLRMDDRRHLADRRIVELLESVPLDGHRVLEVGAGNSAVLCALARLHAGKGTFSGLDYAEAGCRLLRERAEREGVAVDVLHQDLFAPADQLVGAFDVVYSLGVAEHFTTINDVLSAMRRLLVPGGLMITTMPNMAGVIGRLTRKYNPAVYALHVPHTLASLTAGHAASGLTVERSGYLCSTNFGVLSSCVDGPSSPWWRQYLFLSRITTALWAIESRVGDLPHTAWLSPYLYCIARNPG